MKKILYLLLITMSYAQWFDIEHDSEIRSYYISYPEELGSSSSTPLIINMHGFGGNPSSQRYYSEMDQYALNQGIAVVYPKGEADNSSYPSWNVGTFWDQNNLDDVGFISSMIDKINQDFDIDLDRVYACGMSNGGYMAYELACELQNKIAAFGSVTGNFMLNSNQTCEFTREIPIIHFHGTSDGVVNYYPPSFDGALTVSESINFWSEYNRFNQQSMEELNNNVEIYKYYSDESITEFVHYKVYGGGHDWFTNNWGFHASEELINFFLNYQLSDFINEYILGDVNQDDAVNILDIVLLAQIILEGLYLEQGDINEDQVISILDIIALINLILLEN